ncbi:hypothetical protein ALC53_03630 [Atta colombica]|uniref:Uncharacterized protein n=1 Tax=Atta colombica TaxID=520822 RepID=A0A151I576_9HYME|nr:hypothetical protein ALC53_03630 [Atta colombica]
MVSFRGNSIHAPSRDPSVLPSEARVTCGAALSWRGSPERTSFEKGFLSLPRPECFLRLSFFNALMEMKSLRMKTTDPDKGGITNNNVKAVQCQDGGGEATSDTGLLSHVHVSRIYVLPETIRPSSATECVNTRGPGVQIRSVSLLASPSTRIEELLSDMTRSEPDGKDQTDSRIPLRLCTSPEFPRDILRPPARKLPSNNHEKNR